MKPDSRSPIHRFLSIVTTMAIVAVVVFLLVPTLGVPFLDRDEGNYAYFGKFVALDGLLYRDFWDIHFPGLYMIYGLAFRYGDGGMASVRIVHLVSQIATALTFYLLLRRLVRPTFASLAAVAFAVFSNSPTVQGTSANAEPFLLLLVIPGLLLALRERSGSDFLAGVFFGLAIVVKQNALVVPAIPLLWSVFDARGENGPVGLVDRLRVALGRLPQIAAGTSIPILIMLAYFASNEGLAEFYDCTVRYVQLYRDPVGSWMARLISSSLLLQGLASAHPFLSGGTVAGIAAAFWRGRSGTRGSPDHPMGGSASIAARRSATRLAIWLGTALVMTCAGGREFPHYLQHIVPPMCGLGALALQVIWEGRRRREGFVALALALSLLAFDAGNVFLRAAREYLGEWSFRNRPLDWAEVEVGRLVEKRTRPTDRIFVLGPSPAVYYFANRSAPTRFVILAPIQGLGAEPSFIPEAVAELAGDLQRNPPSYFIIPSAPWNHLIDMEHMDWLHALIEDQYELEATIRGYTLLLHRPPVEDATRVE